MREQRFYFCIDMKSFYASVECAELGLNPFTTNLVVADITRGKNALCLAVSPKMKALGVKNRCRLSEIPSYVSYRTAVPRMALYIQYAADIYGMYLDYFSPRDIHVYSIDEAFIDATNYLKLYQMGPMEMAKFLMDEIAMRFHIPATGGVGTNLYLAKIALDITAKHTVEHIGYLDEALYRQTLWNHTPITDFWQISTGTATRLARLGVMDMEGITKVPTSVLYKTFGVNAELLADHAWGRESCLIEDIKNYKSGSKSVSFSQILSRDYTFEEARTVITEMVYHGAEELKRRQYITNKIGIGVGYAFDTYPATRGSTHMTITTALPSYLLQYALPLYDKVAEKMAPIRRLSLCFENAMDEVCEGYDLFTHWENVEKEKALTDTIIHIHDTMGKNAVLHATNYFKESTQRERNTFIGGHRAGCGDKGKIEK